MKFSDYGIQPHTEAWFTLNVIANKLGTDYTSDAIIAGLDKVLKEKKIIDDYLDDIGYDRNVILRLRGNK